MKTDTELQLGMEQVVSGLRNVISSRVVISGQSIEEVHVLADMGRAAKWIVRDVETALAARFGVDIDHRKISVAQLGTPGHRAHTDDRLVLASLIVELTVDATVVHVTLELGDQRIEGSCQGSRSPHERGKLAAQATLGAIESFIGVGPRLVLDHLGFMTLGTRQLCIASVLSTHHGHGQRLVGAALVESDQLEPPVKATLMAVNRRLGHWLSSGHELYA